MCVNISRVVVISDRFTCQSRAGLCVICSKWNPVASAWLVNAPDLSFVSFALLYAPVCWIM